MPVLIGQRQNSRDDAIRTIHTLGMMLSALFVRCLTLSATRCHLRKCNHIAHVFAHFIQKSLLVPEGRVGQAALPIIE